jgi:hypothetical protein
MSVGVVLVVYEWSTRVSESETQGYMAMPLGRVLGQMHKPSASGRSTWAEAYLVLHNIEIPKIFGSHLVGACLCTEKRFEASRTDN